MGLLLRDAEGGQGKQRGDRGKEGNREGNGQGRLKAPPANVSQKSSGRGRQN